MVHHRGVAAAVAVSAVAALAVPVAAMTVVVALALADPELVVSDGVFWASAVAVVVVQLVGGLLAGHLAGPRLARAGVERGRARYALAVAAPLTIALLINLHPVEGIPALPGMLVPILAAAGGVLLGVRRAAVKGAGRRRPG
ncbi:hypothetical protein SAMN04489712_105196 [Thermomonospora echinospora]|uniref:Uncharacterized protein n=1 Tax=Thermomonospora echinospora TaxID=1992 RepID=A0A1H6A4T3_9ACTN|nr:hypothetical protein [Thermomonospora echinospora]SEG43441.1 hypothetical protein SAMN04489712_105196 [Thermomonospora echinospora]